MWLLDKFYVHNVPPKPTSEETSQQSPPEAENVTQNGAEGPAAVACDEEPATITVQPNHEDQPSRPRATIHNTQAVRVFQLFQSNKSVTEEPLNFRWPG